MDLQDFLKSQLDGPAVERLGAAVGLSPSQARGVADEILPAGLNAFARQARSPEGARLLLERAGRVPRGSAAEVATRPGALTALRQVGEGLLPPLLGERLESEVGRIALATGTGPSRVRGLMELSLPLMLGLIGGRAASLGLDAENLDRLFDEGRRPERAGVSAPAAAGQEVRASPQVVVRQGEPLASESPAEAVRVLPPLRDAPERRRGGWLWLLPLLALLLLGGGLLLRGREEAPLSVTGPAENAGVSGPFRLEGRGKPGETVAVSEGGRAVATVTVGDAGTFSAAVPTPSAGTHTYTVAESGSSATLSRTLTATAASAPTGQSGAAASADTAAPGTPAPSAEAPATLAPATQAPAAQNPVAQTPAAQTPDAQTPAAQTPAAKTTTTPAAPANAPTRPTTGSGSFAFTSPAAGSRLPAGSFTLRGTGKAGSALEVFEDSVSLGRATVSGAGSWSLDVPSPAAGGHRYQARSAAGTSLGTLPLSIAAATGRTAACTKTFSLSVQNGTTVRQPFRFGGVGSGRSYRITVSRGARTVGSKLIALDPGCGWSYTSRPGVGRVSYTVRPSGRSQTAARITLIVRR